VKSCAAAVSTSATRRDAHLVGSYPAPDADAAMEQAVGTLGDDLRTLPDGETGPRFHWIIHIIEALRTHPDLELKRDGDWSDYDRTPVFRERKGHRLTADTLDLGYARAFEESRPAFERHGGGRAFQAGIPGDLDMALFVLGPLGALRRRRPFTDATVREIRATRRPGTAWSSSSSCRSSSSRDALHRGLRARGPGPRRAALRPGARGTLARRPGRGLDELRARAAHARGGRPRARAGARARERLRLSPGARAGRAR
jgi:hypothetical protein